jgi:CCR4-NOT transcription complex subunit 1
VPIQGSWVGNFDVEFIAKNNFELLMRTFSEIWRKDNNSLNLSKIIDICQNIKSSQHILQKLTASDELDFSIPLGLLASRREFINLKAWLKDRIDASGENFINSLIDYITNNVLTPMSSILNEASGTPAHQKKLEQILENAHLNNLSLNSIMEAWEQALTPRDQISDRLTSKIAEIRNGLTRFLPDNFGPANTSQCESEVNKLLADVYEGRVELKGFLNRLKELKNSQRRQDEEILACIISNLFQEYPHCNRHPKVAVELTGRIFGSLIKDKIVHTTTTYKICVQCILDALKKRDRLLVLGISALNEIKSMIHGDLDVCKNLFEIDQLRENHADILHEILQNLKKTNNVAAIDAAYIKEVEERFKDLPKSPAILQQEPRPTSNTGGHPAVAANPVPLLPAVAPGAVNAVERPERAEQPEPSLINLKDIENTTLQSEIRKRYIMECENLNISEEDKNSTRFILNNLDRDKLDQRTRDLSIKLNDNDSIIWFSCYLVFDRVPTDRVYLDHYCELITKMNKKLLTKKVLSCSYLLVNLVFEYATHKKNLSTEEMTNMRSIGTWLGIYTLGGNRPIIKKDLDLKMRIYKSFENKTLRATLPIVTSILNAISNSTVFKSNNPYIMGVIGVLIEIKNEYNSKEHLSIMIDTLFKDLKINEASIKHFNYLQRKRNSKQNTNQSFLVNTLPDMICIDTRTLRNYTINQDINLRQLVACAVDLAIKDFTKPHIMQRSVGIALVTTREIVLKDFAFEPDEEKLMRASEAMTAKLAGNLALATCTEPIKTSIKEYLENFLESQTALTEDARKTIKDIATLDNLSLACNMVKKHVVEKAMQELSRDKAIQNAIQKRRVARERGERYVEENYLHVSRNLPNFAKPNPNGLTMEELQIYKNFASTDSSPNAVEYEVSHPVQRRGNSPRVRPVNGQNAPSYPINQGQQVPPQENRRVQMDERVPPAMGGMPMVPRSQLDEGKIRALLQDLEKHINSSSNNDEKVKAVHYIYMAISKLLVNTRDVESQINNLALMVLENIFKTSQSANERLRYYTDILVIYGNYNPKLSKFITEWYFSLDSKQKYSHSMLIVFLRRNLLHLVDFDSNYAAVLDQVDNNNIQPLECIVQVLKCLVIEQRIFAIYTFKKIVEKLIGFQRKRLFSSLLPEVGIFIENLAEFMKANTNYLSSIKFRLTNIEPEYKKLLTDVEEYFLKPDLSFYKQAMNLLKCWLTAKSELEMGNFIKRFEEEISRKEDKVIICFFCYIIDVSCKQAERFYKASKKQVRLDYTYIDLVSKMVTILLKTMINSGSNANSIDTRIKFLEKILTALIIVLTKEHYYNVNNFNNKLFFKILFNILYVGMSNLGPELARVRLPGQHQAHAAHHRAGLAHPAAHQVPRLQLCLAPTGQLQVSHGPTPQRRTLPSIRKTRRPGATSIP